MAGLFGRRRRPPGSPGQSAPVGPDGKKHADGTTTFGERRADDLTPEEKASVELRKRLEEDITLRGRPALRSVRQYLATAPLLQMDGSPVVDKSGKAVLMTIEQHLMQALARSAIMPGPGQREAQRDLVTLIVGPAMVKPEVLEQPRGGDGPGTGGGAGTVDDGRMPTPEEIEADKDELQFLSRIALAPIKDASGERDLTAIDVKAELVRELEGKKSEG